MRMKIWWLPKDQQHNNNCNRSGDTHALSFRSSHLSLLFQSIRLSWTLFRGEIVSAVNRPRLRRRCPLVRSWSGDSSWQSNIERRRVTENRMRLARFLFCTSSRLLGSLIGLKRLIYHSGVFWYSQTLVNINDSWPSSRRPSSIGNFSRVCRRTTGCSWSFSTDVMTSPTFVHGRTTITPSVKQNRC